MMDFGPWIGLATAQVQLLTVATGTAAAAWGGALAAALTPPWARPASIGNVTIYYPFGQGYSQDIDPVTFWGLARSRSSTVADAMELAEAVGRLRGLVEPVAEAAPEDAATLAEAGPEAARRAEIARVTRRIDELTATPKRS